MKRRSVVSLLLAGLVTASFVGTSGVASAGKSKAPTVVGTDASDDWGSNVEAALAPVGNALGQELVEASIGMADAKTVNFIIKVASLPPAGGMPEFTRYNWDFIVDGSNNVELDGKFTNYTRGACDPTAGSCPPPRDPGTAPFFLRGNCTTVGTTVVCEELGLVNATFDAASGTITIPVPLSLIKAKPGSKITGGASDFGGSVAAAASAFVSPFAAPNDNLVVTGTFTIPKK
jgi:hypothetical protein